MVFYIFGGVGGMWCIPLFSPKKDGFIFIPISKNDENFNENSQSIVEKNNDPIPWLKFLFCKQCLFFILKIFIFIFVLFIF